MNGMIELSQAEMMEIDGGVGMFVAGLIVGGAFGAGVVVAVGIVYLASQVL